MEKGRSERERCTSYNRSHMADLKKTASDNRGIMALGLVHVKKHIIKHINIYFNLIQMHRKNRMEQMSLKKNFLVKTSSGLGLAVP